MGRIIPYVMENKKCSKPPTRIYLTISNPTKVPKIAPIVPWFGPVGLLRGWPPLRSSWGSPSPPDGSEPLRCQSWRRNWGNTMGFWWFLWDVSWMFNGCFMDAYGFLMMCNGCPMVFKAVLMSFLGTSIGFWWNCMGKSSNSMRG